MREMWVIAKREFTERVRSKWFIVMTILWPILMVGLIVIPPLLAGRGTEGAKVQIVDHTRQLGQELVVRLALPPLGWDTSAVPPDPAETELRRRIQRNAISGYLVVPNDALDGSSSEVPALIQPSPMRAARLSAASAWPPIRIGTGWLGTGQSFIASISKI